MIDYNPFNTAPHSDFYRRAMWHYSFAWLPQRCIISGERIWLKFAYQGSAIWTGPGTSVIEKHWHSPIEHIMWEIKNASRNS